MNPLAVKTHETDRESPGGLAETPFRPLTPDTFSKGGDTRAFNDANRGIIAGQGDRVTATPPATTSPPGVDPLGPDDGLRGRSGPTGQVPSDLFEFIKAKEGYGEELPDGRARAFWDYAQYSIGYGTRATSSTEVITSEEAERRLSSSIGTFRQEVERFGQDNGYSWTPAQIDSLTSFAYNLGTGALSQVTENGTRDNPTIAQKMLLYVNAGGRPLQGLIERRADESAWFQSGIQGER